MEVWAQNSTFCPHCGTLLTVHDTGDVKCDKCTYQCSLSDMASLMVVTKSFPKPTPEWMVEYNTAEAVKAGRDVHVKKGAKRATVSEECPKCKNPTMEFFTLQLRSADEGQTVFYECPNTSCGHKFSINT